MMPFTTIYMFMWKDLGLHGAEKEFFAVIYGFWRRSKAPVEIPIRTVTEITGLSRTSVIMAKRGDTVHKADRMKLDLFFDPFRRAAEQTELEVAVEMQRRSLQSILDAGGSVDDDESIKKNYNWYEVSYDKKDRKLLSFSLDEKKIENVKKTSGFFGYITLGLDYTALQTLDAYSLRDEQEKYFCQMKTQMGFDRQRNWSEEGKTGRLLILFVGLIISSYVRHIWKTTGLKKQFASTQDILDEMRSIRCIEHNGRAKFITPFVGAQKDICKAFGFDIPEGCGTEYKSRKVSPKRRGRPAKAKTVKLDS
jgi:hypothetical protein